MRSTTTVLVLTVVVCLASAQRNRGNRRPRPTPVPPPEDVVVEELPAPEEKKERNGSTIISMNSLQDKEGNFEYSFETDDPITVQASGEPKQFGDEIRVVMRGSYSYVAIDENGDPFPVTVRWYADENGFHAEGSVIPPGTGATNVTDTYSEPVQAVRVNDQTDNTFVDAPEETPSRSQNSGSSSSSSSSAANLTGGRRTSGSAGNRRRTNRRRSRPQQSSQNNEEQVREEQTTAAPAPNRRNRNQRRRG